MEAMNSRELAERLLEEGCNPSSFAIGSRGAASDAFYLSRKGEQWQVCYTERGEDSPPIHVSDSESQACDFFFKYIVAMRHDHCVGFFKSQDNAMALEHELKKLGVVSWSDQIPYGGEHDPRYRVFVTGKAIFVAREALGVVPRHDTEA
ncbi:SPOR domain-containing protein [Pseudomonas sp. HS6]|uniref:SPOR domain-containing protein n=1 Tax=Pseudomonas sp. HS6 TaxID=2850559 RepID=UPI00201A0A0E|nr:SPOR domain-containing protein [Pseudomonas sp. HS6]UQS16614.1 SPOR domain-containing protein [Pseudomonas sp. HS6]